MHVVAERHGGTPLVWLLIVLSLSLACSAPRFSGDAGTPEYSRAKTLIAQLGDQRFARREEATKALRDMEAAAATALRKGLLVDDAEIRHRCEKLLPRAVAADWRRRADAFEADVEGRWFHCLPMYDRYVQIAGKDAPARKLFAAMVRANGTLLAQGARGNKTAVGYSGECESLFRDLAEGKKPAQANGRLAVLFLVSSRLTGEKVSGQSSKGVSYLLPSPLVSDSLKADATGLAFRRLLLAWAETRDLSDRGTAVHLLFGIQIHRLKEAIPLVERIAKTDKAPPWARAFAVEVLVDVQGKECRGSLEKLLREEAVTTRGAGQEEGRLGDHALGHALVEKGKNPQDYGLKRATPIAIRGPRGESRTIQFYFFDTPGQRKDALEQCETDKKK
jgi:hypothetical protein